MKLGTDCLWGTAALGASWSGNAHRAAHFGAVKGVIERVRLRERRVLTEGDNDIHNVETTRQRSFTGTLSNPRSQPV